MKLLKEIKPESCSDKKQGPSRMRNYRVLHGLTGAAGQPRELSLNLRAKGISADCVMLGESRMGFKADLYIPQELGSIKSISLFLNENIDNYDIFHLHFRPFYFVSSADHGFPTFMDLLLLKAAGKRIVFHFRGSEARINEQFRKLSPYNYIDDNPSRLNDKFPDSAKIRQIEVVRSLADAILVNDPEIGGYVGESTLINRIVDSDKFKFVGLVNDQRPLVVHAPSRRKVKGTEEVLAAIETLKLEGLEFDFRLIENLSQDEAVEIYRQSDIVIDQLRIGWYGVLSVEAMSLGKAVVCYIRDDLTKHFEGTSPVANANPDTIRDVLRGLISSSKRRQFVAESGHNWFQKKHNSSLVTNELINIYDKIMTEPSIINTSVILDLLNHQQELISSHLSPHKNATMHTPMGWHPTKFYSKAAYLLETEGVSALLARAISKLKP